MDEADYGNERAQAMLEAALSEHQWQLGHAVSAIDIEAETCNGCPYATKAGWGHKCDGWKDCRDDIERRERFNRGLK